MNNPVPTRIGHYEIIEKLGQGKNGVVFKAYDTGLQRAVALKLLGASAESQLGRDWRRTVEDLSKIRHPNVGELYAVDEFEGRGVVISEWVDGRTLAETIGKVTFSDKRLLTLATQSARGLKALHDHGIVHGNLTATNLMLSRDSVVKLLDFGMRHSASGPAGEQTEEEDLYRLGVLLFGLAVGRVADGCEAVSASDGVDAPALDLNLLNSTGLERDSCLMISQLLAEDRADRFRGVDSLLATLDGMAVFKRSLPTIDEEQPQPIPRNKYLMTALLAILLIVFWFIITTQNH